VKDVKKASIATIITAQLQLDSFLHFHGGIQQVIKYKKNALFATFLTLSFSGSERILVYDVTFGLMLTSLVTVLNLILLNIRQILQVLVEILQFNWYLAPGISAVSLILNIAVSISNISFSHSPTGCCVLSSFSN
jgi:hypothetical protein